MNLGHCEENHVKTLWTLNTDTQKLGSLVGASVWRSGWQPIPQHLCKSCTLRQGGWISSQSLPQLPRSWPTASFHLPAQTPKTQVPLQILFV